MMKTPGAILLLAVLLGSYKALPAEEENLPEDAPHPGTFPKEIDACNLPLPPHQCQSDTDCQKTQKCCNLCRKRCVSAVREKSGVCPTVKFTCMMSPLPRTCHHDTDCVGVQKCCQHGCGFGCTDPVTDAPHPGTCPKLLAACNLPLPPPECHSDTDCAKTDKCCNLCGTICVSAVRVDSDLTSSEELGNKADKWVRTRVNRKVHTGGDKDCKKKDGGEFQVSSPGSTISLGRTKEDTADAPHPGTCPKILAACNLPLPPPECQSDTDCPKTEKCCNLCGKICVSAVRLDSDLTSSEELGNKADKWVRTRVNRKVHTGGDKDCKKKDGGEFQVSSPGSTISLRRTKEDTAGGEFQVSSLGSTISLRRTKEDTADAPHPGTCPKILAACNLPLPPPKCQSDTDCPKTKKCCSLCGFKCVSVVRDAPHPGTCPKEIDACKLHLPLPKCQSDTDCPKTQKCCNLCGKRCVPAVIDSSIPA
ncbi:uncharacterized protein [Pleurodeles waltl]